MTEARSIIEAESPKHVFRQMDKTRCIEQQMTFHDVPVGWLFVSEGRVIRKLSQVTMPSCAGQVELVAAIDPDGRQTPSKPFRWNMSSTMPCYPVHKMTEAKSPKGFMRHLQGHSMLGWAASHFERKNPTLFRKEIPPFGNLRGNIWLTFYTSSIWYRVALVYGPGLGGSVFGLWEVNPRREEDERVLLQQLQRLHSEVMAIFNHVPELNPTAQRLHVRRVLNSLFHKHELSD